MRNCATGKDEPECSQVDLMHQLEIEYFVHHLHFYVYYSVILFWSFEWNNRMIDGNGIARAQYSPESIL